VETVSTVVAVRPAEMPGAPTAETVATVVVVKAAEMPEVPTPEDVATVVVTTVAPPRDSAPRTPSPPLRVEPPSDLRRRNVAMG
jgi:hypothetical protein